jgi:hypothetical protein
MCVLWHTLTFSSDVYLVVSSFVTVDYSLPPHDPESEPLLNPDGVAHAALVPVAVAAPVLPLAEEDWAASPLLLEPQGAVTVDALEKEPAVVHS